MPQADVADEWKARLPGLNRLWKLTTGRPDVRIAVLDGPPDKASVAQSHPIENGRIVPHGVVEHATLVQSIIAGSSDLVVPGIAPGCTVLSIPIFEQPASPNLQPSCSQARLAGAICSAVADDANIINISAAQQADLLALSSELSGALQDALDRDILVVAAGGNQGCACDTIPASAAGVLAVGAHDDNGVPLLSSNWGPNQRAQGVIAPGRDVPGACVGGGLCRASGTSFAAATVSGVAGLLMSMDAGRGIAPSGRRIRKALLDSSVPPQPGGVEMAGTYLTGRLDVSRAVDCLLAASAPIPTGEENLSVSSLPEDGTERRDQRSSPRSARAQKTTAPIETAATTTGTELVPADCGCGGGKAEECSCQGEQKRVQLVYAIGRLGLSFINQARRDSIWRSVNGGQEGDLKPITDAALQNLFKKQPFQAQSVIWTLNRTEVPMYAIIPSGAFAAETYQWLVKEWQDAAVEFVSIPGALAGKLTLYDGQVVDAVVPDLRGMYSWETKRYVQALREARKKTDAAISDQKLDREMSRFFGKIYFSIRNRGLSSEERALNAAATNAFNFSPVIVEAGSEGMSLRDVSVERSPLNRPGSEYFDVLLTFFDPLDRQGTAPLRARFTIDVSDTVPVMIGEPVVWFEY